MQLWMSYINIYNTLKTTNMTKQQKPDIHAALAVSRDVFCAGFVFPDYDEKTDEEFDPLTALLLYDGSLEQPWGRIDIPRNITDICRHEDPATGQDIFVALSTEGDVYYVREGTVDDERIIGAGVESDDATGLGYMQAIRSINGRLLACGDSSQFYQRDEAGWTRFRDSSFRSENVDYPVDLGTFEGLSLHDIYISGHITTKRPPLTEEESDAIRIAIRAKNYLQSEAVYIARDKRHPIVHEHYYLHWDGERWLQVPALGNRAVSSISIEEHDLVWMAGSRGLVLRGNAREGFEEVYLDSEKTRFLSLTKYRDDYILCSNYELHRFDGKKLHPFKLEQRKKTRLTPFKVQVVEDVLFYFDFEHGINCWDGTQWEKIAIPRGLLKRNFSSIKR